MDDWDSLTIWLHALNLSEYVPLLTEKGYDSPEKCSSISDKKALRSLGVTKVGHVNRLFRAIEKLRGDTSPNSATLPLNASLTWMPAEPPSAKSRSMTLLNSSGKQPPPVPVRRSMRRVTSSPNHSRSPTPPDGTHESLSLLRAAPPPVLPRGKSLRRTSKSNEVNRTDGPGVEEVGTAVAPKSSKSGDPNLSPIPQSPMPGAVEKPPEFPVPQPNNHTKPPPTENHIVSEPPSESKKEMVGPPKPKPRTRTPVVPRRVSSSDTSTIEPRVTTPEDEVKNISSASTNGAPRSAPTSPTRPISREESPKPTELPPLPPKKTDTSNQIIIPKEDVVFELEDAPMPTAGINTVSVEDRTNNNDGSSVAQPSVPQLPPKDSGPPSFAPPPPPPERKYFKTVSKPNASPPPVPQRKVTPPPPEFSPPPLPPHDMQEVPLPPPRTTTLPENQEREGVTSPVDPNGVLVEELPEKMVEVNVRETDVPSVPDDVQNGFVESTNQLPLLPPKETITPPPPPPITPEDYPQDSLESCSDSDSEEDLPFISIQSIKSTGGDVLTVSQTLTSLNEETEDYSSSSVGTSSADQTPVHRPTIIRQQLGGLKSGANASEMDDRMMVVSPAVGDTNEQDDDEYMNQEIIDQVLDDDEEFDERIFHEPLTVKGSGPLSNDLELKVHEDDERMFHKPLTVKGSGPLSNDLELKVHEDDGVDYMNQEAIDQAMDDEDEDEIERYTEPFRIQASSPIKSRTIERQRNLDKDYENQDVLDEDIIPFVTLPSSGFPAVPMSWQSRQHSDSTPAILNTHATTVSPDYDVLPPRSNTKNFDTHDNSEVPALGVSEPTPDNPPPDLVSRESSVGDDESQKLTLPTQNGPTKQALEGRDSMSQSGTFPRMKVAVQFGSDTYTSDSNSSIATTPGSLDFDSSYSLSADSSSFMGGSAPKSNEDFFDGSHLIRTAGTFACGDKNYKRPDLRRNQSETTPMEGDGRLFTESIFAKSARHGSETFHDVPKIKEGYLFKKGGRRSERPWQRRWMTFNGSELKYFKNQSDKDKLSRNIVPLQEMIDIKKVQDDEKSNRFDLVVINRVFQFYATSADESQLWVDVLHAAISKFKPQEHEFKEGGNMHTPEKQGVLLKQGHGALNKGFRERYVALKGSKFAYYETHEDFVQGRPIHVLEMCLSSVRPDTSSKLPRFIITMNSQKQYVFQASSELVRKEWLDTMTTAILTGLDTRPMTITRGQSQTTSQDILAQIQENPSNTTCADCSATEPSWGVINKGIMVCINCSGVHRSLGTHVSKVRSIELDRQIWKSGLVQVMVKVGNENSNKFWERHFNGERLPQDVERDIRENFIRAKYEMKSWIPRPTGESQKVLNKLLYVCVQTDNLMRTIELLAHGADACGSEPSDPSDPDASSPIETARKYNQDSQVELLEQNGGLICKQYSSPPPAEVSKKGHLYKTGSDRSGWKRRYCSLDKFRGFVYFKSETDLDGLGHIHFEEMLSVSRCDDESSRDPRYKYCFEVNTQGRGYLFCADTEEDMADWIHVFEQIIPHDAAENLGFDKVGYLKKKDSVGGFRRKWFTLKGKSLACYRREREEIDEIDLRKVTELKGSEPGGTYEQQCAFSIFLGEKAYHFRADNPTDAESWVSAIKHTQVSGIPLAEQQLTSNGIPILVHKCLQFVESHGMEAEGLYRLSGGKVNSRKLVLAFNQDARGVVIDPEVYTVHDVTGTLKQFFRSLPDPILTHRLYQSFINTIQSDHESQMYQLQSLIEQLPPVNRETLRRVAGHLKRVAEYESKNKMGLSNLVRLFAPTLMTVDGDPVTFENTQHEYTCVHTMIKHYKWLFQVDEQEEKKEEAMKAALRKIKEAEMMQSKMSTISSSMDFLTRVYIGNKDGDSYGVHITGISSVADVVEKVTTDKALPPDHYALYLVLGDSESHRVLSFSERLLAVLCSTGSDCFLCLKPNTFGETLKQYIDYVKDQAPVTLQVREKKKWKKYPCTVRNDQFVQFKDSKCHHEHFKLGVQEFDVFAGIEGSKMDVKNPMPTRWCFWLKAMRGEDKCKYLCADKEEDMLKIFAWIVKAKYPDRLQTPLLPTVLPPATQPPLLDPSPRGSPVILKNEELRDYANVKVSGKKR